MFQDKSVASTAARLATVVMGGTSEPAPAPVAKSEVEIARENMRKKMAKKGKKKKNGTEEVGRLFVNGVPR